MGVIQSTVNQAIGAAGEAVRDIKILNKANEIAKVRKDVESGGNGIPYNQRTTAGKLTIAEDMENRWDSEKRKIEIIRKAERRMKEEMQSTKQRLKNIQDLKERERLSKSVLGGALNV